MSASASGNASVDSMKAPLPPVPWLKSTTPRICGGKWYRTVLATVVRPLKVSVSSASSCVLLVATSNTSRAGITKVVRHSSGSASRPTSPLQRCATPLVVETADHTCTVVPGGYEPEPNPPSTSTSYLAAGSVEPEVVVLGISHKVDVDVDVSRDSAEQPPMSRATASPAKADTVKDRGSDALVAAVLLAVLRVVLVSLMNVALLQGSTVSLGAGGIGVWLSRITVRARGRLSGCLQVDEAGSGRLRGLSGW